MRVAHTVLTLIATYLVAISVYAQSDTLNGVVLDDVEISALRTRSHLTGSTPGTTVVSMELMEHMPRILGNADPLHYVQMLPDVQLSSEYDAGLHIQGCDNQHNQVGLDGVTIFNPSHLLGFFSVFNPTHFQSMLLQTNAEATHPNRLGGILDLRTSDTIASVTHGTLSIGPMSSQGTMAFPLSSKSSLTLSARAAYLNLLYGHWLKLDDEQMRYGFDDYNLTWTFRPSGSDIIKFNAYHGHDKVEYDDFNYYSLGSMAWTNTMVSLLLKHSAHEIETVHTLYFTHYHNRFNYEEGKQLVTIPSGISDIGYHLEHKSHGLDIGAEAILHFVKPQEPVAEGYFSVNQKDTKPQKAQEVSAFASYEQPIGGSLNVRFGMRASAYHIDSKTYTAIDPTATISMEKPWGNISLQWGVKHQYLFRLGFSTLGLPTEFYIGANEHFKPQYAHNLSLSYENYFFQRLLRIEVETFFKHLYHQQEYSGNVFDMLYEDYDITNILQEGRGRSYGAHLLIEKRKGAVTGWIGYTVGRSMRKFNDPRYTGWLPSAHDRPHELNVVATLHPWRRWNIGGTFVYASGNPYTRPLQFYLINNNIITEFSGYNARRLPAYMRLDMSASYEWNTRLGRSGMNLSLYNVTMHRNPLFYRVKIHNNRFMLKSFRFATPILPSINYYFTF